MTIVSPPPGVSSAHTSPPIASASPRATARPRPDPVARRGVAVALEGQEDPLLGLLGHARARCRRRASAMRPPRPLVDTRTGRAAGWWRSAFSTTLPSTRSSRPGSASTSGRPGRAPVDPVGLGDRRRRRPAPPRRGRPGAVRRRARPAWRRDMSSRLPMRASSRSADSSMAASSSASSSGEKVTSRRAQAADRRLDAGQRGAQVVRDRREQGRPGRVVAGQRRGLAGGLLRARGAAGWRRRARRRRRAAAAGRPAPARRRARGRARRRRSAWSAPSPDAGRRSASVVRCATTSEPPRRRPRPARPPWPAARPRRAGRRTCRRRARAARSSGRWTRAACG